MSSRTPGTLVHALRRLLDALRGREHRRIVALPTPGAPRPLPRGLAPSPRILVDARHRFPMSGSVPPVTGDAAEG